jgi:hypothetical protein
MITKRQRVIRDLNEAGEKVAAAELAMMPSSASSDCHMDEVYTGYTVLIGTFTFNRAPQGHDYWWNIYIRMGGHYYD